MNGILLPFLLIFMLVLVNKQGLMGDYKNSRGINTAAWGACVILIILSLAYFWTTVTGQ